MGEPMIAVRNLAGKGRCVIALSRFEKGEIVERTPAIALDHRDTDIISATDLYRYCFARPDDPDGCLFVLGLASLINHDKNPNISTIASFECETGWKMSLRANRKIMPGEELTRHFPRVALFTT